MGPGPGRPRDRRQRLERIEGAEVQLAGLQHDDGRVGRGRQAPRAGPRGRTRPLSSTAQRLRWRPSRGRGSAPRGPPSRGGRRWPGCGSAARRPGPGAPRPSRGRAARAWRAAARQVMCAIWVPVTKPTLVSGGQVEEVASASRPRPPRPPRRPGAQAWMPAFWSQTVVSQSAAMAAGAAPPITQPKNRPLCEPRMPPAVSATRSSITWVAGDACVRPAAGQPRAHLVQRGGRGDRAGVRPSSQAKACSAARIRAPRSGVSVGMGPPGAGNGRRRGPQSIGRCAGSGRRDRLANRARHGPSRRTDAGGARRWPTGW